MGVSARYIVCRSPGFSPSLAAFTMRANLLPDGMADPPGPRPVRRMGLL